MLFRQNVEFFDTFLCGSVQTAEYIAGIIPHFLIRSPDRTSAFRYSFSSYDPVLTEQYPYSSPQKRETPNVLTFCSRYDILKKTALASVCKVTDTVS
ncbi:MAG: hypothetical protein IKI93_16155, partial [Clostridia bacterium]|nr:hypothetical protein [Clostridia bacterium]